MKLRPASGVRRHLRLASSLSAQGIGNTALNLITLGLNFGTTLILSRLLGSDGFGVYAFAIALATLISVPAVLGLTPLLVREVAAARVRESWGFVRGIRRRANQGALAVSAVLCTGAVVVFVLADWPHGRFHAPALLALPLVPLVAVTSIRQGVMQGLGRVVLGRLPEAVVSPGLLLVAVVLLAATSSGRFSPSWVIAAAVASAAAAAVLGIWLLDRATPAIAKSTPPMYESRRWIRAAVPIVVFYLVSTAGAQFPTVLLGALSTPRNVGIYSVAARIANLVPFLLVAVMPALMPAITELHVQGRLAELQQMVTRSARLVLLASLPFALIALVLPTRLLALFGSGFTGGETALQILVIAQVVNVATGFPGTTLMMLGDASSMATVFSASTAVSLLLAAVLIPALGAEGAATASAASLVTSNVLMSLVLWRRRRIYSPAFFAPGSGGLARARRVLSRVTASP